ncbi:MAG: thioredoxin family protein [Planctomycetota bacterium]
MPRTTATLLLGALATLSAPAAAGETWYADYDAAVEAATKAKKDLFVDFTGSDWCGWCIKLHDEVFAHDEFLEAVQREFVLVALDFPHGEEAKAKVPNAARNAELNEKYGIRGYPTVLLMNVAGEVFAQTGYQEGGPQAYVEHLAEITKSGREALASIKEIVAAFDKATGDAKVKAWEKVIDRLEAQEADSPFVRLLAPAVRWAFETDPQNASGFKRRAVEALLATGQVDEAVIRAGRELDPKNEEGLLERVVDAQFQAVQDDTMAKAAMDALDALLLLGIRDEELSFRLQFTAARWCAGPLADPERAKKYAAAAKAIGTDDARALQTLDKILGG